ncbi:MAG TPA: hypothetical protein VIQ02_20855, partial [Jiangellaceae bacterium]
SEHAGAVGVRYLAGVVGAEEVRSYGFATAACPRPAIPRKLIVTSLILMSERNFYDLARRDSRREVYDALAARLTRVWQRAFGLTGEGARPGGQPTSRRR